ncbi:hypothetical protein V5799_011203 [Amblyomma americanum]|uniref:Granulins domain-containing protein n=1 Tax=Amblyomma americanum TaxID=6943 RepID=A0AAQ4EHQ9_AMBAM
MANAVCCPQRSSCCPEHYVCDNASNLCAPANTGHKKAEPKTTAAVPTASLGEELMVKCPTGDTYCFQGNSTCCRQSSDTYGCCPDRDAVCCSDLINCCPRGFACIRGTGNCVQTAPVGKSAVGDGHVLRAGLLAGSEQLTLPAMKIERGHALP